LYINRTEKNLTCTVALSWSSVQCITYLFRCLHSTIYLDTTYRHISLKSPARRTLQKVKC